MTMGSPVNGLAYCRARTYAYSTAFTTKTPASPAISAGVVVWALTSASARKFTFGSAITADYGVYQVKFNVGLLEYPGKTINSFKWEGMIVPRCSQDTLTGTAPVNVDLAISDTNT